MKKTWHTVFLILLICLDAALLLLPLLPGYRALFDIGPYPGRLPAFRFLKLAGYALFFSLTAYGCGRLLARIRRPRLRWLPAAVFALIATALVCLHNNELHMLCRLDSGWVHVPHMYENLVRTDLTYRGGLGIFRYVLPWAGTLLLCVLAGTYSLQQFLSLCRKAFAALRRRCLLRRAQTRQALPCSLLVLSMADRAQFAAELVDRLDRAHIVRTSGAQLRSRCATPSGALDDAAGSLRGNADLLIVEDLEAFVCGTEQWQRVCAFFFQNIIEDGTDVIAAADDPAKTAPEFWYRMTCACPFSVRTLKE